MTVVIHGAHEEIDELIARRRALGQDGRDEVWDGIYHMAPHAHVNHSVLQFWLARHVAPLIEKQGYLMVGEFNLGDRDNFRVPDFAALDGNPGTLYVPTALMVGEILSPDDETYAKFPFYAKLSVQEIVVLDPDAQQVRCYGLDGPRYVAKHALDCAGIDDVETLSQQIPWP